MRDRAIHLSGYQLERILDCVVEKRINEHGRAVITGYINADTEEALLQDVRQNYFLSIMMAGEQEEETATLFQGIVEQLKIESVGDLKKAILTLVGATRLLESKKQIRKSPGVFFADFRRS